MIMMGTYRPAISSANATSHPVGGDPSKPGAWTQEQIDDWNRVKACAAEGHPKFWEMGPRPTDDTCPGCDAIIRSVTDRQGWIDHWAEQRAEEHAYDDVQRAARIEDSRW